MVNAFGTGGVVALAVGVDTELALSTIGDTQPNPGTTGAVAAFLELWNGTSWDRWRGTTTNGADVNVKALPNEGQQTMVNSVSVVVASDQTAVPISGTVACSNCSGSGASDVDDSSFTLGTDPVAPVGYLADDVTPDSVDEGDVGLARMSLNRVAYFQLRDGLGNERGMSVTAANAAKVDGSAVTQPVSGTFWQATQPVSGTFWQATQPVSGPLTDAQLRASAVPVTESSAAATAASLAILDDWDESDRAKVNPIVGQAGVAAAAGDTSAATQRFVEAGNPTLTVGQITCATTATQIASARAGRKGIEVTMLGTGDAYLGASGVTTAAGHLLLGTKGTSKSLPSSAALYCIVASGTQVVSYVEVY
jgi:hypothetical protein